jgi:peptide/nickel transport system substrate-binding protein
MTHQFRTYIGALATATALTGMAVPAFAAELNVAYDNQPNSLDAQMSTTLFTRELSRTFYETLVTLNGNYQPVPHLAESYDISDDRKTYTFNLREGVTFHNGKVMAAEDVVASMNRWKEVNSRARRFFEGSTFEATDDSTVVLTMPEAKVDTLHVLASWNTAVIMPKEVAEAADETGVKEYIGTGPFQFVEWKQDQLVHVTKYDDYKSLDTPASGFTGAKEAMVDDIYFQFVSDPATRGAGLQSGQYDIAMRLSTDDFPRFDADPNIGIAKSYIGFLMMNYNKEAGPFTDVKMRQAINAAVNPSDILLGAYANPEFFELNSSYNIEAQTDWYTEAGAEHYNQNDAEKAQSLLEEAGYDGEEITLLAPRVPEFQNAAIVIKSQLESIGVSAKVDTFDFATYAQKRLDPQNWDITVQPFSLNPIPTQWIFFNPNTWGWTDDEELLGLVAEMQDGTLEEAKELWPSAQERSWEYLPITKIGDAYSYSAYNAEAAEGFTTFDQGIFWNVSSPE